MFASAKTLEIEWKNAGINVCTVWAFIGTDLANGEGKLCRHLQKDSHLRLLTAVKILQCLYIDDGASIFMSRANLTKGLNLI